MFVTDYTTYDEIRSALGVADDELEDILISLPMYADVLQVELEDIHANVPSTYDTVRALASPTDVQTRFLQAAHLFATYAVARQLTASLPLSAPEQITDGKAGMRRNQDNPHKQVIEAVNREYARFRARLDQMFAVVNSSSSSGTVAKTYFGVISPASDPILGT